MVFRVDGVERREGTVRGRREGEGGGAGSGGSDVTNAYNRDLETDRDPNHFVESYNPAFSYLSHHNSDRAGRRIPSFPFSEQPKERRVKNNRVIMRGGREEGMRMINAP